MFHWYVSYWMFSELLQFVVWFLSLILEISQVIIIPHISSVFILSPLAGIPLCIYIIWYYSSVTGYFIFFILFYFPPCFHFRISVAISFKSVYSFLYCIESTYEHLKGTLHFFYCVLDIKFLFDILEHFIYLSTGTFSTSCIACFKPTWLGPLSYDHSFSRSFI